MNRDISPCRKFITTLIFKCNFTESARGEDPYLCFWTGNVAGSRYLMFHQSALLHLLLQISARDREIYFSSCCRVCNTCAEKQSFISRCRICREKLVFYFIYQKNRFLAHVRRCVVGLNFQSTSIYFSLIGTNCISFDSHLSFFKPHYVIYTLPAHFYYYFIICWFFTALLIWVLLTFFCSFSQSANWPRVAFPSVCLYLFCFNYNL